MSYGWPNPENPNVKRRECACCARRLTFAQIVSGYYRCYECGRLDEAAGELPDSRSRQGRLFSDLEADEDVATRGSTATRTATKGSGRGTVSRKL
jgi:hypothetical protein